ncbi:MAG: UDP-N-acetylmuramate dehydrogenase [Rikenellaceae bacterium]
MKQEFYNISLLGRNSFGLDQRASKIVEFDSVEDLVEIFSVDPPAEWYVLSGGNNVLFTQDYQGVIITPTATSIEIVSSNRAECRVRVAAGVEWDDFVEWCVENELWGAENLSMIPGKVGAAPIQNIGAYGVEAKDIISEVEMFCPATLNSLTLHGQYCDFGYRDSIFKRSLRGRVIITSVVFTLSRVAAPNLGYGDVVSEVAARGELTLKSIREAICAIRSSKLPDPAVTGNAGSFFKNPVVEASVADAILEQYPDMPVYPLKSDPQRVKLAAGWLIDKAGFKGHVDGRVGVHPKQALVLINLGGATGGEVMALAHTIVARVEEKFGVAIEPEVNVL